MSAVENFGRASRITKPASPAVKTAAVIKGGVDADKARAKTAKSWWSTFAFPAYSGLLEIV